MTGWVYRIISISDNKLIYIGSTFGQYFCLRAHKKPSAQHKHQNLYGYVSENGGWNNFQIQVISEFETLEETRNEEIRLIQELQPVCNIHHKKSIDVKRKERNENQKKYLQNNPDQYLKRLEYGRAAGILRKEIHIDCPCGGKYTLQNKTNHYKRTIHKDYEASQNNSIRQTTETI